MKSDIRISDEKLEECYEGIANVIDKAGISIPASIGLFCSIITEILKRDEFPLVDADLHVKTINHMLKKTVAAKIQREVLKNHKAQKGGTDD